MVSCGILVKENDPCKTVLYNIQLEATYNSYSNKALVTLLYRKQLSY
jgi:hypothetical protein